MRQCWSKRNIDPVVLLPFVHLKCFHSKPQPVGSDSPTSWLLYLLSKRQYHNPFFLFSLVIFQSYLFFCGMACHILKRPLLCWGFSVFVSENSLNTSIKKKKLTIQGFIWYFKNPPLRYYFYSGELRCFYVDGHNFKCINMQVSSLGIY